MRSSTDIYTSQWNALKTEQSWETTTTYLWSPYNWLLILSCSSAEAPEGSWDHSQSESERTCVLMADAHRHWAAYWGWLIFTDWAALCWRKWHFQRLTWLRFTHINEPQRRPFNSQTASEDINKEIHYKNKHNNQNKMSMRWALTDK